MRRAAILLALTPTAALGQATSYVYDTTTNSTSTSTSTNTNTNINQNTSTSTATNTNYNVNSGTMTNINQNTSTSTSTSTNTNYNNDVSVSTATVNQTTDATNRNINTDTSTITSTSTSNATSNNTNINQNSNVSVSDSRSTSDSTQTVSQKISSPPPSAIAPSMMSYSQDLCTTGQSGAVQTQILGFSAGRTVRDQNCERIKLSKTLYDMGMRVAAVSLLCQDDRVFRSMEMAGTPCPYMGLIGAEATAAWVANNDKRPDAGRSR